MPTRAVLDDATAGDVLRLALVVAAASACSSHQAIEADAPSGAHPDAPPDVVSPIPSLDIATGDYFTCARRSDRTVVCLGDGASGALGNGSKTDSSSPAPVTALTNTLGLSASFAGACTCDGTPMVECWGDDRTGELDDGGQLGLSDVPVPIASPRDVVQLSTSQGVCALLGDSTVACWGRYVPGGPIARRGIAGLVGVATMAPRFDDHMCVVMNDGSVRCWDGGEIATPVTGLGAALAVAVGYQASCALLVDHTVACWGSNSDGQLGDGGAETETSVPVKVSGLSDAVGIAMSSSYACATRADGTAVCWGNNEFGNLGNGTTSSSSVPVAVSGLTSVVGIAPNEDHACAQLADGTFACWGGNDHGGLGVPPSTTPASTTPIAVPL